MSSPYFALESPSPLSPNNQRSAYPFPRSSSTSRYQPRRGSTSSAVSIGGSLDIPGRRNSTVRESSQNAISTLLLPPIVRTGLLPHTQASVATSGFRAPTTKDIPPVTLSNIPHVPQENFRDYLSRIGPLFERFQRGRAALEQQSWLKKDIELEKTDRFAEAFEKTFGRDDSDFTSQARPSSAHGPASPATPRRRSSIGLRRNRNDPTPLSTIPPVYFDNDFHLENPRTFDIVSERAEIVRPPPGTPQQEPKASNGTPLPPRKALATNAILQEKLSWYMDTVEVHLINSISNASSGFFAALGSLKELQTEAEESVAKIQSLRADLRRLDQEVAVGGLEVAAKQRRRANILKLAKASAQLQKVVENVKKADELVDDGDYDGAADQMDIVGKLVRGEPSHAAKGNDLIDLRPLRALQGLDAGLQELQYRVGAGFAQHFTTTLIDDLRQHVEKIPRAETLKRWSRQRGVPPTYTESSEDFRRSLLSALQGLQRAKHTVPATAAYSEAVTKEIKALIRKHLPSSSDDDADSMVSTSTRGGQKLTQQEKSTILARNLRALDAEDSESLLINVYTSISEALRRTSTQTKVLLDVTSSMQALESKSPPQSPRKGGSNSIDDTLVNGNIALATIPKVIVQEELSQALDLSSLLGQAVDTAQTQISRILKVRNEQSIRLPKDRFLRYFTMNRLFADECEAVSGRGSQALKSIINAQISGFVQVMGTSETERIANCLDNDDWNAVDFSSTDEALLQRVLSSTTADPPEWAQSTAPLWQDMGNDTPSAESLDKVTTNGSAAPASNGKSMAKPAYIDETRYILVSSAATLLSTIDAFLALTSVMPSMTPAISNSLLDVLRMFNSRSCQLILGAGATRSAGLKNITTKHLALASQALSFIIALVPYMRECARRHLPTGQINVLADFDKTKRLYQEHQSGIHDKLVEIMTSRSLAHVKAMSTITFDDASPDESKPSPYMETLTKETLTLYRVLSRHLSEVNVSMIMRQIFSSYKEQWTKAFSDAEVTTAQGEKRLRRDAECFDTRLSKAGDFGETGKAVLETITSKAKKAGDVVTNTEKKITEEKGG